MAWAKGWDAVGISLGRMGAGPSYVVVVDVSIMVLLESTGED